MLSGWKSWHCARLCLAVSIAGKRSDFFSILGKKDGYCRKFLKHREDVREIHGSLKEWQTPFWACPFPLSLYAVPPNKKLPGKNLTSSSLCPCEFKTLAVCLPGACGLYLISTNGGEGRLYSLLRTFLFSAVLGERIVSRCVKRMKTTSLLLNPKNQPYKSPHHPTHVRLHTGCPRTSELDSKLRKLNEYSKQILKSYNKILTESWSCEEMLVKEYWEHTKGKIKYNRFYGEGGTLSIRAREKWKKKNHRVTGGALVRPKEGRPGDAALRTPSDTAGPSVEAVLFQHDGFWQDLHRGNAVTRYSFQVSCRFWCCEKASSQSSSGNQISVFKHIADVCTVKRSLWVVGGINTHSRAPACRHVDPASPAPHSASGLHSSGPLSSYPGWPPAS